MWNHYLHPLNLLLTSQPLFWLIDQAAYNRCCCRSRIIAGKVGLLTQVVYTRSVCPTHMHMHIQLCNTYLSHICTTLTSRIFFVHITFVYRAG